MSIDLKEVALWYFVYIPLIVLGIGILVLIIQSETSSESSGPYDTSEQAEMIAIDDARKKTGLPPLFKHSKDGWLEHKAYTKV
jgi:hypothetical protein